MAKYKASHSHKTAFGVGLQHGIDKVFPYALGPMLFLSITCFSRLFSVIMAGLFLLLTLGKTVLPTLRQRLSPLTLAVWAYSLVCLLSGLWCHYRSISVAESARILTALSLFGILLFHVQKNQIRHLLQALSGTMAAVGLLCLDASGTQLLVKVFRAILGLLNSSVDLNRVGYEEGIRITGIFNNANVSGGLLAFGLLITLYLYQTASSKKESIWISLALGMQALAFFLSFSMGAMASFAVACLVYIICAGKGKRFALFVLMLECVLVTVICSFAAFPFLGEGMSGGLILLGLSVVTGLLIYALDSLLAKRLLRVLDGHDRIIGISAGALLVLAVVYVVLAFRMTGGISLVSGELLERAVNPAPGTYTVSVDGIDPQVRIYTQNEADLMMHTQTTLYQGVLSEASFTVPEDSKVVWFQLSGEGQLNTITLSDGTSLPLGYKLLPGFAANRLQALWANQNFIQRLVFFRDGIALWLQSPIIGWGIGGVEGQVTSVQKFFYESKYVHNHFIQMLDEAGIVGLGVYLFLLGSAIWLLLRSRKLHQENPLLPMLAACMAMMMVHAMTEVVWSTQPVLVTIFILFLVIILEFHNAEACALAQKRWVDISSACALWGLIAVFGVLMLGNQLAPGMRKTFREESNAYTPEKAIAELQKIDRIDIYENVEDKTNLMGVALQHGHFKIASNCARYLRDLKEYDASYYLAAHYYMPLRDMPGLFDVVHTGVQQERSNPAAWNGAFDMFAQIVPALNTDLFPVFVDGIVETGTLMDEANAFLMAPIQLTEQNQALLNAARSVDDMAPEVAQATLLTVLNA